MLSSLLRDQIDDRQSSRGKHDCGILKQAFSRNNQVGRAHDFSIGSTSAFRYHSPTGSSADC
ncbi:MAG: hypothetical protein O3A00_07955 [Planctomycetota bacterium]|nr:hypothetical protein [Planctomycetota bacterium]